MCSLMLNPRFREKGLEEVLGRRADE